MTAAAARWTDLPTDQPIPGVTRRRVIGDQAMISHVTLEQGFTLAPHSHDNEQFAAILQGRLRFEVHDPDGPRFIELGPGEVLHLPANVPHGVVVLETAVVLDVFSPVSEGTGIDRA